MELRWIDDTEGATVRDPSELPELLGRTDGFLWLDIPEWSDQAEHLLTHEFEFHPMAVDDCRNRNHVPRVHVYADHLFLVIHAPEIGTGGHVHYLELDQFIGEHFLVTVHGPLNPNVPLEAALRETRAVGERLEQGRLQPTSPFGLTYAIVSAIARREAALVGEIARQVGLLEQRVMAASGRGAAGVPDRAVHRPARAADHPHHGRPGRGDLPTGDPADHLRVGQQPQADEGPAGPVRERRLDQPGAARTS